MTKLTAFRIPEEIKEYAKQQAKNRCMSMTAYLISLIVKERENDRSGN